ncbi:phosphotransferase [Nocardia sp. NPDC059246]|uniref:phosphotransferase n=1 Tax=unclassified Nocardia TaxID=2637762 RepID=UPI0036AE91EF
MKTEDLTEAWFSAALGQPVEVATRRDVMWGTGTKVFFELEYRDAAAATALPTKVCVKGGFGTEVRAFGAGEAYIAEARFYGEVAPRLGLNLPRCWYAAVDVDAGQGVLILEDLRESGTTFGDPTEPWSADRVAAALEQQAIWHKATWGESAAGSGLPVGSTSVRAAAPALLSEQHWNRQQSVPELAPLFDKMVDRAEMYQAFEQLWQIDDSSSLCLAHGDAHVGNTFIDAQGRPGFLDWQCPCLGPWSYDVAYFLVGALPIEVRQREQEQLLRLYLSALASGGGPQVRFDDAWLAYRRSSLHGFFWALTPPEMQPLARVAAMAERHVAAIEDLDTFSALAVTC